jgi:hypothetical protein
MKKKHSLISFSVGGGGEKFEKPKKAFFPGENPSLKKY